MRDEIQTWEELGGGGIREEYNWWWLRTGPVVVLTGSAFRSSTGDVLRHQEPLIRSSAHRHCWVCLAFCMIIVLLLIHGVLSCVFCKDVDMKAFFLVHVVHSAFILMINQLLRICTYLYKT